MISLDQVLLLQKKVETAVERISALNAETSQLKSENDALRRKCAELTKALSEKTELVSNLEADQTKIEQGILLALDRLDTVENSVLNAAVREQDMSYSTFINGLTKAGVKLNRKALSNMAIEDPAAFKAVVEVAKKALNA